MEKIQSLTRQYKFFHFFRKQIFLIVFCCICNDAYGDDVFWLDQVVDSSDLILIGKAKRSELSKSDEPFFGVSMFFTIEVYGAVSKSDVNLNESSELNEVTFNVNIFRNTVPTGTRGLFFLKRNSSGYEGVANKYSLFELDYKNYNENKTAPIANYSWFLGEGFNRKIRLSNKQKDILFINSMPTKIGQNDSPFNSNFIEVDTFFEYLIEYCQFERVKNLGSK